MHFGYCLYKNPLSCLTYIAAQAFSSKSEVISEVPTDDLRRMKVHTVNLKAT